MNNELEMFTEDSFAIEKPIDTQELDTLVKIMDETETELKTLEEKYKAVREKVLSILVNAGKSKYFVEGLGTISTAERLLFPTPKSKEEKEALFAWLKSKGEDFYYTYCTINSQSLQSLAKMEMESSEDPSNFKIPGIADPTSRKELRFRRGK